MSNKYHFSLLLQFDDDIDIDKLEKKLGLCAYRKNTLSESVGKNKTAKLWFKSNEYQNPDTFAVIEQFVDNLKYKLTLIKKVSDEYHGNSTLTLYFDNVNEKPYIRLSHKTMLLLAQNNITFGVDFKI